jgi:hypothetical protein
VQNQHLHNMKGEAQGPGVYENWQGSNSGKQEPMPMPGVTPGALPPGMSQMPIDPRMLAMMSTLIKPTHPNYPLIVANLHQIYLKKQ